MILSVLKHDAFHFVSFAESFHAATHPFIHPSISALLPSLFSPSFVGPSFVFWVGSLVQSIVEFIAPVSCSMPSLSEMVAAAWIFNSFWLPLSAHVEQEGPLAPVLQRAAAVVDALKSQP